MYLDFFSFFKLNTSMGIVLAIVSCALLALLYVWHNDSKNKVDLTDLICNDGHIDEKKVTRLGAWIVSTWGFVYLILANKFTEWYFTGYMAIWVGNAIVDKYLSNRKIEKNQDKI